MIGCSSKKGQRLLLRRLAAQAAGEPSRSRQQPCERAISQAFSSVSLECFLVSASSPCSTRVPSMPRAFTIASAHCCVCSADRAHFVQQIGRPALQAADLLAGMCWACVLKRPCSCRTCNGDLLEAVIEDAHQPGVPPHPDLVPEILGRHRVIGLGHFHVPVAVHLPLGFVEEREALLRQRQQRRPLGFDEHLAHLPLGGAVNPRVGHRRVPSPPGSGSALPGWRTCVPLGRCSSHI